MFLNCKDVLGQVELPVECLQLQSLFFSLHLWGELFGKSKGQTARKLCMCIINKKRNTKSIWEQSNTSSRRESKTSQVMEKACYEREEQGRINWPCANFHQAKYFRQKCFCDVPGYDLAGYIYIYILYTFQVSYIFHSISNIQIPLFCLHDLYFIELTSSGDQIQTI